ENAFRSLPSDFLVFGGGIFDNITDSRRALHRLGDTQGVMLSQVHYNAPANGIGNGSKVKADERVCIIRSINGHRVHNLDEMYQIVSQLRDKDCVVFDLEDVLHGWGPAIEMFKLALEFFPTKRHSLPFQPKLEVNVKRLVS